MKHNLLNLENFDRGSSAQNAQHVSSSSAESIRLEGFEAGYKSGWDDANAETEADNRRIGADLERTLADLAFSHEEARREILTGMSGLFQTIISTFLPVLAAEAVLPRVMEQIDLILPELNDQPLTLAASPATCGRLHQLSDRYMSVELSLRPEPAYADGRVKLSHAGEAMDIDLSGLLQNLSQAIRDFAEGETQQKEAVHA